MLILALETSSMVSSVAVASEQKLLAELTVQTKLTHSETLLPHIEQVLQMAGVKKEELQGIAVSIGPGSFTGLRIGLATAKSIAYALQLPLLGISTLEALAWHYPVPGIYTAALLDAQKGNAYAALYAWEHGTIVGKEPVTVASFAEVLEHCAALERPVVLVGDIVQKKAAKLQELPENVILAPAHMIMPRAANVAQAALRRLAAGESDHVMDLEPVYIRRSEAEVLWEKRHAKAAE